MNGFITSGGEVVISIVGQLEGLNRAVDQAESMMNKRFGDISRQTGTAMTGMGAAITGALGLGVSKAAEFEQQLRNAVSVTGLSGEAADEAQAKMEALAMTLGQQTAFSAAEVAAAFYDLNSKGFDAASMSVEELIPFLNLASATQSDLTATTEIMTATLKGFGMANSDAAHVADVFAQASGSTAANMDLLGQSMPIAAAAARATGVSFEETSAALGVLYDNGVTASTAGTGLRNIMVDITNGTPALVKELAQYGLTTADLDIRNKGLAGAFAVMKAAGMDSTAAIAGFGKENGVAAALLMQNSERVAGLTGELQKVGGIAQSMASMQLQSLSGQLKILWGSVETLMISVGQGLVPALTGAAQAVTPVINQVVSWMKANPQLVTSLTLVGAGVGGLMLVLGPLLVMLPGIVAAFTLFSGALGMIPAVAAAAAGGLTAMAAPVVALSATILATGYAVTSLIGALRELAEARREQEASEARLGAAAQQAADRLRAQGVEVERLGLASMDAAQQQAALTGVFTELSMRQREGLDTVGTAAQEAYARAAQAAADSANQQASIWSGFWNWLTGLFGSGTPVAQPNVPAPPGPQGFAQGGVVGFPGYGTGGRIGRDLEAFRWNERGGEIAVAPVGTRILDHGQSVAVARDAIAAAMAGGGGGGGGMSVTINIDRPVVNNKSDIEEIARGVEGALDRAWSRRVGFGRV